MTAESGLVFVAGRYLDLLRERDTLAAEVEQLRAEVAELRGLVIVPAWVEQAMDDHVDAAYVRAATLQGLMHDGRVVSYEVVDGAQS